MVLIMGVGRPQFVNAILENFKRRSVLFKCKDESGVEWNWTGAKLFARGRSVHALSQRKNLYRRNT